VTVAPLILSESDCVAAGSPVTTDLPGSPTLAQGCWGMAYGKCDNPGDTCLPAAPSKPVPPLGDEWNYCISLGGIQPTCPMTQYANYYVFWNTVTDTRTCSSCTSVVSLYSDGACSDEVGSAVATSSGPVCSELTGLSPLGSKSATPPVYTPGACQPGGGLTGTVMTSGPTTLCCLM
jgi:hypothetical protein